jgi:hypothetical protein
MMVQMPIGWPYEMNFSLVSVASVGANYPTVQGIATRSKFRRHLVYINPKVVPGPGKHDGRIIPIEPSPVTHRQSHRRSMAGSPPSALSSERLCAEVSTRFWTIGPCPTSQQPGAPVSARRIPSIPNFARTSPGKIGSRRSSRFITW